MEQEKCRLFIDGKQFDFEVEGEFSWGGNDDFNGYVKNDGTIRNTEWEDHGYSILELFKEQEFVALYNSIEKSVIEVLIEVGVTKELLSDFSLEKYHEFVKTDSIHNKVISKTREFRNENLSIDVEDIVRRISNYLNLKIISEISEFGRSHVQVRISRPNSLDINPPHRDSYLSFYEDIINLWIPICGSNEFSSLPVVPQSHKIPESQILRTIAKGAKINGNIYNVPCLLKTKDGDFHMVRPNPKLGEALIFTPYLIHGAAVNSNKEVTRISLEFRFSKES